MERLVDHIKDDAKRRAIVDDCMSVLDSEVQDKRGVSGFAVKGSYKIVGTIRPGFLRMIVDGLLEDTLWSLQPFYEAWRQEGNGSFGTYLQGRPTEVAEAILAVTDKRAEGTQFRVAQKAYWKLRPTGVEHIREAAPRIGDLFDRHLDA